MHGSLQLKRRAAALIFNADIGRERKTFENNILKHVFSGFRTSTAFTYWTVYTVSVSHMRNQHARAIQRENPGAE